MMTVKQVSRLTGVSVRALHHYHQLGLLVPSAITDAGYRLYDDKALERLQMILLFKELSFPLKDIAGIIDAPFFDRNRALDQQIELLELKREHLDNVILLARGIRMKGTRTMDFKAFDTRKIDEYAAQAKASWGETPAYKEFEKKSAKRTRQEEQKIADGLMAVIAAFGRLQTLPADDDSVQQQVQELRDYLSAHYYTCTRQILSALGDLYAGGGSFTDNIDQAGGPGTGVYADRAIKVYCQQAKD